MNDTWAARHGTTLLALVVGLVLTVPGILAGVQFLREAGNPAAVGTETRSLLVLAGLPSGSTEAGNLSAIAGWMVLIVAALGAVALVGVAARRQWGRHAAIGIFGIFALFVVPVSIAGLASDPPGENAGLALLVGLTAACVVVLLVIPPTTLDFERAEMARLRATATRRR
jgi:hypothetical protein